MSHLALLLNLFPSTNVCLTPYYPFTVEELHFCQKVLGQAKSRKCGAKLTPNVVKSSQILPYLLSNHAYITLQQLAAQEYAYTCTMPRLPCLQANRSQLRDALDGALEAFMVIVMFAESLIGKS
jgi:hypothetical protein